MFPSPCGVMDVKRKSYRLSIGVAVIGFRPLAG